MHILENYSCFQQFFFKFSIFYTQKKKKKKQKTSISAKNIFEDIFFFCEAGHIPDFENEDNISIGISLTFEVICTHLICT